MKITFPHTHGTDEIYMDCLRAICGDTKGKSMIDLCCNKAPHTPLLGFEKRIYVDILPRTLDHSSEQQYFHQMDVLKLGYLVNFDVSICSDGIEHLSLENGVRLRRWMESQTKRQVLFTPLNPWMMSDKEDHEDPEGHHSVWSPDDIFLQGYASIVFPEYHPSLGIGAFFAWRCDNLKADYERVYLDLMKKHWVKTFVVG
jgi:hypothetical protein